MPSIFTLVVYWGGRYIPWLARLVFFFWVGSYVAWRFLGMGSSGALLTGAVVVTAMLLAGEVGQFRSRRETVVRREADPRQFDAMKSEGAGALEIALLEVGFARRGDCSSTKGNAIVRRRIFVHAQQRSIVAVLFHTSALILPERGKPRSAPEERSVAPTSLSMISYAINGTLVRSRSTAPGDKLMRPIARESVEDFLAASPRALLDAHALRIATLASRDSVRMIDVDAWSAFALADALDDAWARRLESFAWTPMAYRMLVADYRWLRDLPTSLQVAAVLAILAFGPGLFYYRSAILSQGELTRRIPFTPTSLGAAYDAVHPPVYPGAVVQEGGSAESPGVRADVSYVAKAPVETVRRWYEARIPAGATEVMVPAGSDTAFTFFVKQEFAHDTVILSPDTPTTTDIDISVVRGSLP